MVKLIVKTGALIVTRGFVDFKWLQMVHKVALITEVQNLETLLDIKRVLV